MDLPDLSKGADAGNRQSLLSFDSSLFLFIGLLQHR
jgi:hypothetical protein